MCTNFDFRPPCVLPYFRITSNLAIMRRLMMQWLPIQIKAVGKTLYVNLS